MIFIQFIKHLIRLAIKSCKLLIYILYLSLLSKIHSKHMKKTVLFLLVLFLSGSTVYSQSNRKEVKKYNEALEYISNNKYTSADNILKALLKKQKNNLNYVFNKGICEIYTEHEDEALEHFNQIINDYSKTKEEKNVTRAAFFYKAKAFHNLYQFDEEIETLNKLNAFELNDAEKEQFKEAVAGANNARTIFFDFKPIIVTRLDILNSGYDDHTPIPTSDGKKLYFTSKRPGGISGDKLSEEGKYYEDIWFWDGKNDPVNVGSPVNTIGHDATGGLSLDGSELFIYRTKDNKPGNLYSAKLKSNGKWADPVKLGRNINKKRAVERHAALSPDGKKLYFSSNVKGGKGGRDIWVSELQPDDSTWSVPENLDINTKYDEEAPYMLSDGRTFYFSSKGYKGMGGYDIFKCMLQSDGTFSEPENIGFPINTVEDDVFFFPVSNEDIAYFTRRKTDNAEIFKTMFPDNTLIVESDVKGKVLDAAGIHPLGAEVNIYDVNSETEPDAYTLKLEKAKYKSVVIPDKDYKFVYEASGYVFDTEDIPVKDMIDKELLKKSPVLVKIEIGKTKKSKNTFFDKGNSDLNNYTKKELDVIAENLNKYDSLVVNFSTENYSEESSPLSNERKQKVVEYLRNKNISADRIYTDLSSRDIADNIMEYTIYDVESVKKVIEDKEKSKEELAAKYYIVEIYNLFFDFDKPDMQVKKNEKLDLLCNYLSENSEAKVAVVGYTDAVGPKAYNDKLAERRALMVKKYMKKYGVKENQIKILAFGEDNPVALNKKNGKYFEPSKKFNRRVEFQVIIQGKPNLKIIQFKELPPEYKDSGYNPNYKR